MNAEDMDFLDAGGFLVRHAQVHILGLERRGHLAAAVAGERHHADAELVRGVDRIDDVRRVPAGGDGDQGIAAPADRAQRLGERLLIGVVVRDRGEARGIGAQRDRGERRALHLEAVYELGGEVLRVRGRTAVAAGQDLTAVAQGLGKKPGGPGQRLGQRGGCGLLEVRALGEVRGDAGLEHAAILLDVDVETHTARGIGMLHERADASAQWRAALERPGKRRVLAPRDVAERAAAPQHLHGVRVVRVVRLARELEAVADAQLAPHFGGGMIAKAGKRRALHDNANLLLGPGEPARKSEERPYSPKASRIHCTWTDAPSTRNTSKRHRASGRRVRYRRAAASRRWRFAAVTLSPAPPNPGPLRMRTSANTSMPRSSAIRSISPRRQLQLRSRIRRPAARRSPAQRSSARAPWAFMARLTNWRYCG